MKRLGEYEKQRDEAIREVKRIIDSTVVERQSYLKLLDEELKSKARQNGRVKLEKRKDILSTLIIRRVNWLMKESKKVPSEKGGKPRKRGNKLETKGNACESENWIFQVAQYDPDLVLEPRFTKPENKADATKFRVADPTGDQTQSEKEERQMEMRLLVVSKMIEDFFRGIPLDEVVPPKIKYRILLADCIEFLIKRKKEILNYLLLELGIGSNFEIIDEKVVDQRHEEGGSNEETPLMSTTRFDPTSHTRR